jgi:cyclophilin family peptidyl-prolyl cis-trans isomerase
MPRSRRFRKSQNQVKPEWGKNNPQTKAKNKKLMIVVGVIAVVAIILVAFVALGQNMLFPPSPTPSPSPSISPTPTPVPTPKPTLAPALTTPAGQYSASGTQVLFETSMGNIIIQMRDDKPITTQNFVNLVNQGFYDGTNFHRIIDGFMIQGGQNQTRTIATIADEIGSGNRNIVGSIAMAKTDQPNSATSEFFINVADNGNNPIDQAGTKFDSVYTVFGQVISGLDIVMNISKVPVTTNVRGETSQPVQPVTLIKAQVLS